LWGGGGEIREVSRKRVKRHIGKAKICTRMEKCAIIYQLIFYARYSKIKNLTKPTKRRKGTAAFGSLQRFPEYLTKFIAAQRRLIFSVLKMKR
ncbi:MAG: hypothetical protein LBS94_00955, partial [Prevotellaceae bacterium]|nr:hypothetical protein [Prevotellaceae bacterium]